MSSVRIISPRSHPQLERALNVYLREARIGYFGGYSNQSRVLDVHYSSTDGYASALIISNRDGLPDPEEVLAAELEGKLQEWRQKRERS
jgi:hypothetical protein